MAWIALEGMRFHAFHGVYEAEQTLGTEFIVDVFVKTQTGKAAKADDLALTINYETVYLICKMEMEKHHKLIETVLDAIIEKMKFQFSEMQGLRVRVRKLNPPLGGRVDAAWIEEELDFMSECPKCKKKFIAYKSDDCWEKVPNVFSATREKLTQLYGGKCLCVDCLKQYAG